MSRDAQQVPHVFAQSGAKVVLVQNLHGSLNAEPRAPATTAERHRRATLLRVRADWIDGVLKHSLYKLARIELGLVLRDDLLELPLSAIVQVPDREICGTVPAGTSILSLFDTSGQALLILGAPGTGKTTLLLELADALIARALADESHPIPIVLNLSTWALRREPLERWLVDELNQRVGVPKRQAKEWVDRDFIVPLLDGLDEVNASDRSACVAAINQFRTAHGLLPIALCSRTTDLEQLRAQVRVQGCVEIQPLTAVQIHDYLRRSDQFVALRSAFENDPSLEEVLATPLMLWVAIVAYRRMPLEFVLNTQPENRRGQIFENFVHAMLTRRGRDQRFEHSNTVAWLSWLARALNERRVTVFYFENLEPSWLNNLAQRTAASVIAVAGSGVACALISCSVGILFGWSRYGLREIVALGIIGSLAGAGMALVGLLRVEPTPVEVIQFNWVELRSRIKPAARSLVIVGSSAAVGLSGLLLPLGVIRGVLFGLLGGVLVGLLVGLVTLLTTEKPVEFRRSANQGTIASVRNAVLTACIVGSTFGVIGGLQAGLSSGLLAGLPLGLVAGMYAGGIYAARHFAVRLLLWSSGAAPLNYTLFLNFAVDRILLHRVGAGFKFLHRALQEHLAAQENQA